MKNPTVKIINRSNYPDPARQSDGSSGFDLYANIEEPITVENGSVSIIPTGIYLEMPVTLECQIRARSGLAAKHGISLVNGIGTIDSDYRGEIKVILTNVTKDKYTIYPGDRIAQMVFAPVVIPEILCSDQLNELNQTVRGAGGFGHTGN